MLCDLHTHSIFSDGTCTPKEIIDEAIRVGLSAVALTDHNTVDGLPDFQRAGAGRDIEIVLGNEFSADYNGKELHIVGLFIKPEHLDEVSALMRGVIERKEQSNVELINALAVDGYRLDYDEIKRSTPKGKINRAHIATALTEKGYTASVNEAFDTVLSKSAGYYKEPKRLTAWEVIEFIELIGAVSVLAHPFLQFTEDELRAFLTEAKGHGLVGMECYYSANDEKTTERSLEIAEEFGLLPSGGSDYHGARKPDIGIGSGRGNLEIPYECYLELKKRSR